MTQNKPEGSLQNAKIAIIGEAPGAREDETGLPFQGKAGQLLDRMLTNAGIIRSQCYLTNVVKERPPSNDITKFIRFAGKGHVETSSIYDIYEEQLYRELAACQANVFVPLGNIPLYALTRKMGNSSPEILNWRGSTIKDYRNGRKVIPTIHPAASFRGNYLYTYYITHDLIKIRAESEFPEFRLPQRELIIRPTYEDVMFFLGEIQQGKLTIVDGKPCCAFDIEVINQQVSCISFAQSPMRCMTIPFRCPEGEVYSLADEMMIMTVIASILENPQIGKVCQNGIFDSSFMFYIYGIRTTQMHDTMVAHGILYPDFPKSLGFLCSMYTDEPYYKNEGKDSIMYNARESETFWLYCAKDSACALEIILRMIIELAKQNNLETYYRQIRTIEPFHYIHARGIDIHLDEVNLSLVSLEENLLLFQEQLQEAVGYDIPDTFANSGKQKREYFIIKCKLKQYLNLKTKKPTFNNKVMKKYATAGNKAARIVLQIVTEKKLRGSYLKVKLDEDKRLRGSWNPIGTKTGRPSCGKVWRGRKPPDIGLPMMTIPDKMKDFIYVDKGYIGFNVDLAQAENRIVAYIAPEPSMIKAFENKEDVHNLTAALIFGIPLDQVSDEPGSSNIGDGTKSQRFFGKRCNHALNYGLGPFTFADQLECSVAEAKILINAYHNKAYPAIRNKYHAGVIRQLRENKTLTNPYGRKRKFLEAWGYKEVPDYKEAAFAQIPQSTVADKIHSEGLSYVYYEKERFERMELLNYCYDSLTFQIPLDCGWIEIHRMVSDLINNLSKPIPFEKPFCIPVDLQMGLTLGSMKEVKINNLEEYYNEFK